MAVMSCARWRPSDLPSGWPPDVPGWLVQGDHSFSGDGLGEADAVAAGLADVGVVHEPVDGGGGQGFRHELVEARRVKIRADRDAAALVGGVDDPVEALGGVGSDGQQPDVVDDDEVGPQDAGDGLGDGVVGPVPRGRGRRPAPG